MEIPRDYYRIIFSCFIRLGSRFNDAIFSSCGLPLSAKVCPYSCSRFEGLNTPELIPKSWTSSLILPRSFARCTAIFLNSFVYSILFALRLYFLKCPLYRDNSIRPCGENKHLQVLLINSGQKRKTKPARLDLQVFFHPTHGKINEGLCFKKFGSTVSHRAGARFSCG